VDLIFGYGNKSLPNFSVRLFTKYSSPNELAAKQMSSSREIEKLDRVRIDFIKSHLQDRNGDRPLSDEQWRQCKMKMYHRFCNLRLYRNKIKQKH
jgi:hypothetical protein